MSTRARVKHRTKAERQRFSALLRLGVWIFLGIFLFTVAGGIVVFSTGFGRAH